VSFCFFILYGLQNRLPPDPLQPAQSKHSLSFSGVAFQQSVFYMFYILLFFEKLDF